MNKQFLRLIMLALCITNLAQAAIHPAVLQTYNKIECTYTPIERRIKQIGVGQKTDKTTIPQIRLAQGISTNWSGYAAATNLQHAQRNSVSNVVGTWIVPTVSRSTHDTYSSAWVGIDGYSSASVEQIGTDFDWTNGVQTNYAWFEMYPNPSYLINGFPVNPGDSITGQVSYLGNNTFRLTLVNNTRRTYTVIPAQYTKSALAQRSSAEWILEAPYENGILPLSHDTPVLFTNCMATINSVTGAINNNHWASEMLIMETPGGVVKASTSNLSPNGTSFTVTWKHE